jgi:glutathione S-transferase
MIELYVFPPSPNAFKVMAVANHLGIETKQHFVDLVNGAQYAPDYLALNPNGRMPTLKDGDYVLWESNAITQYLAGKKPESGLVPKDEKGRLDVTRWQFWELAHWGHACGTLIFERVVKPAVKMGDPDPAKLKEGTEAFHRAAKVLDAQLKGKTYITGNTLTVADFGIGAELNLAGMAQIPVDGYAEIKRWYGTLCALPAWQKTLAQCQPRAAAA